jgi:hypothetical protein
MKFPFFSQLASAEGVGIIDRGVDGKSVTGEKGFLPSRAMHDSKCRTLTPVQVVVGKLAFQTAGTHGGSLV